MSTNNQPAGKIVSLRHESEILKNNPLGDPAAREVIVYLPPGFDEGRRYPVVYALTGFTGRGRMMLNDSAFTPNFAERLDKLIAAGRVRPMMAVLPDCFTRYGGSQYLDSSATGDYEDYLIREIVPFVDERFPTVRDRNARAVMGKSSGGYGALRLAMRRAETFGLACSTSGDCYFEHCYLPDFPKAFRAIKGEPAKLLEKFWDEEARKGKDDFSGLNIIGMSACYSPNPSAELGFDLPFDTETGAIRPQIWTRWLAHDPVRMAARYAENLKSLKLLFIDAGTRDEFFLDLGARVLSRKLEELGVAHEWEEFDDGHSGISYRQNRSLELISRHFAAE
jgi:S-formylglutathione hydrolase FrmB